MNCWDGPFKRHHFIILIVLMLNRYTDLGSVCCVSQKSHPVPSWTWIIEVVSCTLIHLKCSLISLPPETDLSGKRRNCSRINEKLFAASQLSEDRLYNPSNITLLATCVCVCVCVCVYTSQNTHILIFHFRQICGEYQSICRFVFSFVNIKLSHSCRPFPQLSTNLEMHFMTLL